MKRSIVWLHSLAFIALAAAHVNTARAATPTEQAAAQALFDEGLKLLNAGKAREACPKIEESDRLDPAVATKFQLARCYEATGRTASAWALYVQVADASHRANNARAEQVARERGNAISEKLVRLSIVVSPATQALPGLSVRRDGIEVGQGVLGTAIPVDPGAHEVSVTATGRKAWSTHVDVSASTPTQEVDVPELEALPAAAAADEALTPTPLAQKHSALRTVGWVGVGVGAAGLVTGGVLALTGKSQYDGADACGAKIGAASSNTCSADSASKRHDAIARENVATWVLAGGAALAAAGVVIVLAAPRATQETQTSLVVLPGGVSLQGRF